MTKQDNIRRRFFSHLALALALLISSFIYFSFFSEVKTVLISKKLSLFPDRLGDWQGSSSAMSEQVLNLLGVEDYMMRRYSNGNGLDIWVYVGYYGSQTEIDKIHSPKNCLPAAGWQPISTDIKEIHLTQGSNKTVKVKRYLVQKGSEKELVLYWYHSRGRVFANEYRHKMYLIWDSIINKRTDSAIIRLSSRVNPDVHHTSERLVRFLELFFPALQQYLPES